MRLCLKSLDAIKDDNLEIVAEESTNMFISCTHNAGEIVRYKNRSFKNMENLKYFGKTVTNQNYVHDENCLKGGLNTTSIFH